MTGYQGGVWLPPPAGFWYSCLPDKAEFQLRPSPLDAGPCSVGVESTIVSLVADVPVLLRPGGLSVEDIEAVIGPLRHSRASDTTVVAAPGMLPRHYATTTPFTLLQRGGPPLPDAHSRVGLLAFQAAPSPSAYAAMELLSPSGDLREAAANLFLAMRRLDARRLDCIIAEPVPDHGLSRAINDRLRRAAAHWVGNAG